MVASTAMPEGKPVRHLDASVVRDWDIDVHVEMPARKK